MTQKESSGNYKGKKLIIIKRTVQTEVKQKPHLSHSNPRGKTFRTILGQIVKSPEASQVNKATE